MGTNSLNIKKTSSANTGIDEHGSKLLLSKEKSYLDNFIGVRGAQFKNKIAMFTRSLSGQWHIALSVQD
jgi:hypothetical protein